MQQPTEVEVSITFFARPGLHSLTTKKKKNYDHCKPPMYRGPLKYMSDWWLNKTYLTDSFSWASPETQPCRSVPGHFIGSSQASLASSCCWSDWLSNKYAVIDACWWNADIFCQNYQGQWSVDFLDALQIGKGWTKFQSLIFSKTLQTWVRALLTVINLRWLHCAMFLRFAFLGRKCAVSRGWQAETRNNGFVA